MQSLNFCQKKKKKKNGESIQSTHHFPNKNYDIENYRQGIEKKTYKKNYHEVLFF